MDPDLKTCCSDDDESVEIVDFGMCFSPFKSQLERQFFEEDELVVGRMSYIMEEDQVEVKIGGNQTVKACSAAMGFAFVAGTTNGHGAFDFKQGDNTGNLFWKLVRNLLKNPIKEQKECQQPKLILLGEMKLPYDWAVSFLRIPMKG